MIFRITNVSGSDLVLNGKNLAPGNTMDLSEVSLALRTLEEKKAIKIEHVEIPKVQVTSSKQSAGGKRN